MNKYAVYTTVVGNYDKVLQPIAIDERFDYILFCDSVDEEKLGVWQVRPIPYEDRNNMRKSRYVKCHPSVVLDGYEASLYIDANIQIATPYIYKRFFELLESGVEWAGIKHPDQHCAYDEICTILSMQWVHDYEVVSWYAKLKNSNFPEQWGLFENNVIFRRHTKKVEEVGKLWWQTLEKECKRDQFSLMYCLWEAHPKMTYILPEDECPRTNSENFNYYPHNPHKRIVSLGLNEKIRNRCMRVANPNVREGYHRLFDKLSRYPNPLVMLFFWQFYAMIAYGPRVIVKNIRYRIEKGI